MEIERDRKRGWVVFAFNNTVAAQASLIVYPAMTAILLIFQAVVTRFHSPRTETNPRNRNCRKRITDLTG